ncbi:odorant receptor Or1-like [Fopius arisanus]|uniref:Odorant receptor Or1-like n=1 Tax=Fopius arisanus TaxID=64838 RepID=A0A9R1U8K5_9HYME|nr:PREDICTED: odorant receptor Or1-like [Fopius arisanus]
MVLLHENLQHLHYIGLWRPVDWPLNSWRTRVYRLYTIFVISALYWFAITETMSLFTIVETIEDLSDSSFMLLTTIGVCFKVNMMVSKKGSIESLISKLEDHPHRPINTDEMKIRENFNGRIRLISRTFGTIGEVSVTIMTVSVFFQGIPYGDLPYKAWIPYDYSTPLLYWFTFCLQLIVVIYLANIVIAFDTTLIGLFDFLETSPQSSCLNVMVLLQESFLALQCVGLWPPLVWKSREIKTIIYGGYTTLMIIIIHWFTLSESLSLVTEEVEDVQDFSNNCFMLLSMISICVKAIVMLSRRSDIVGLLNALEYYPHGPMGDQEQKVQENFNQQIRFYTLLYAGHLAVFAWLISILTFFQGIPFGVLPYKAWVPYDYSQPLVYWFTFCLQVFSLFAGANMNIGFDTVVPGFFMQICAQFNILKCRLRRTIDEFEEKTLELSGAGAVLIYERQIINCVDFHQAILEMSDRVNSIFNPIIFVQYSASSIIICVSVFMISQVPLFSPQFMSLLMYVSSMLLQIFMLCAFGNQVTIECQSLTVNIYSTKWYLLTNRAQKYLILMMARTLKPVIFMSGHIITLSLSSFRNLLKQSYSAYTLLQQFSD